MDDLLVRIAYLCADGSSQAEAHSSEASRSDQLARIVEVEMLYRPHLMLAYVCRYDGIHRHHPGDRIAHLLRIERIAAFIVQGLPRIREHVLLPLRVALLRESLVEHPQNFLGIAHDVVVGMHVLVDLRSVYVYVDYLRLACERVRIECHSVREPAAYSYEKIALVYADVRRLRSVHSYHSRRVRIAAFHSASAHYGDRRRSVHQIHEFVEFLMGSSPYDASAADQHRFFRLVDHADQLVDILNVYRRFVKIGHVAVIKSIEHSRFFVLLSRNECILGCLSRNVLKDVDEDRSRSAASGNGECPPHGISELIHIADLECAFCYREHHSRAVYLLERILSYEALSNIARNKNYRG